MKVLLTLIQMKLLSGKETSDVCEKKDKTVVSGAACVESKATRAMRNSDHTYEKVSLFKKVFSTIRYYQPTSSEDGTEEMAENNEIYIPSFKG